MKKNFVMSAFSLMEMMIVLLIVAIIAAASAPMISKKMMRQTGTGDSPWVFTGNANSIAFNPQNRQDDTVYIGTNNIDFVPDGSYLNRDTTRVQRAPLVIRTNPGTQAFVDANNVTHTVITDNAHSIAFANRNNQVMGYLGMTPNTTFFSNVIPEDDLSDGNSGATIIGNDLKFDLSDGNGPIGLNRKIVVGRDIDYRLFNETADRLNQDILFGSSLTVASNALSRIKPNDHSANVVIGDSINANNIFKTIVIGHGNYINRAQQESIVIGSGAGTDGTGMRNIAIGFNAATGVNNTGTQFATAIGSNATATGFNTISLGNGATTSAGSAIAIGGGANASGQRAIALGAGASAGSQNAIAIGRNAAANNSNSVAIGNDAQTDANNQIMLGHGHRVVIPGDLVIRGNLFMNTGEQNNSDIRQINLNGEYLVVGNAQVPSDIRLKNVGEKFTSGLEEIKKLEFFNYTFKKDENKTPQVGVMAQDLRKVFPASVTEGSDGYLRIRWDEMFYAALNAIKELDNRITEIRNNIAAYFNRVEKLEAQIDEQQKIIESLRIQNAEFKKRLTKIEGADRAKGVNKGAKKSLTVKKHTESEAE